MKARNDEIDNTKGILIWLVVFYHVMIYANKDWTIRPYIFGTVFISTFHMPSFFLLSGMLFNKEKWTKLGIWEYCKNRSRRLLIPYLVFEIIGITYKLYILKSITLQDGIYNLISTRCNVGADWFLPAMFLAQIFMFLCVRLSPKARFTLVTAISVLLIMGNGLSIPANMGGIVGGWIATIWRSMLGFVFMIAGDYLNSFFFNIRRGDAHYYFVGCIAILTICTILSLKIGGNDFFECMLPHPLLYIISGIAGLYIVLFISSRIPCSILTWMGQNSLTIMGTHQIILYTVQKQSSAFWVIGMMLLIFLLEVIIIYTTNRMKRLISER